MTSFSEEQMAELKECFRTFDRDGNGFIDAKELDTVMRQLGQNPTRAEIKRMIEDAEESTPMKERDGMIEFSEFVDMMEREGFKSQQETENELKAAFQVFDRNGDGKISREELAHTMTSLGDKMTMDEVQSMLDEADADGNGYVDYKEFVKIMTAKH